MNTKWKFFLGRASCLLSIVATLFFSGIAPSFAEYTEIISIPVEYTELAPGVRYELHQMMTEEGWIVVHLVRSSLSAMDSIVPLYPEELTRAETLSSLVQGREDIIAAVNGDYFDYASRSVLGRIIDRGRIVQTSNLDKNLAHFSVLPSDDIIISYEGTKKHTLSGDKKTIDIDYINKAYFPGGVVLLFDRSFGEQTPRKESLQVVEYRVENHRIVSRNDGSAASAIPSGTIEDGFYVVQVQGKEGFEPALRFEVGEELRFQKVEQIVTGISGGAQLVKDGRVVENFSHNVVGNHPRTVLGVEEDGKTLIMATINGRSTSFRGIRQSELAELILKLGAHHAMILDGGGSTEMIVKDPYLNANRIVSFLSDGSERRIYNGLGVSYRVRPTGVLYKLRFRETKRSGMVGLPMQLDLDAIDTGYSKMNAENVKYEAIGVPGRFEGDQFIPSGRGEGVIIAKSGDQKAYMDIRVSGEAVELLVERSGNHYSFRLLTDEGYVVDIPSTAIDAYVSHGIARFDPLSGSVIPLVDRGRGFITFTYYMSDRDIVSKSFPLAFGSVDDHTGSDSVTEESTFVPMPINRHRPYSEYRITDDSHRLHFGYAPEVYGGWPEGSDGELFSLKNAYVNELQRYVSYLEVKNSGGYIRTHSGRMQWAYIIDLLRNANKPVVIRFSDTYYFRDRLEKDLLFTEIENCNQPVILIFRAYQGATDIFRYRGACVVEIKVDEVFDLSLQLEKQIRAPEKE